MNSTILVSLCSIALAIVLNFEMFSLPSTAKRLPQILIWIIVILSIMMIFENIQQTKKQKNIESKKSTESNQLVEEDSVPSINWKEAIYFGVSIVSYIVLIPIVGYILSTSIFTMINLINKIEIKKKTAIIYSIGLTFFVWIVFVYALRLPVPLWPSFLDF